MIIDWPNWTPRQLVEWMGKSLRMPEREIILYRRLGTDPRMREVWEWHESTKPSKQRRMFSSASSFCHSISTAMRMPAKPGDMAPRAREKYFQQVRDHIDALQLLLAGTMYDGASWMGDVIEPENLADEVVSDLASWGVDETGHTVGYWVDEDGVRKLSYLYPSSEFMQTLSDVRAWTHWDDYWDGGIRSSRPIRQSGAANSRTVYFTCSLYEYEKRWDRVLPFPILATVANVALELGAEDQLDEEAVRKQVRRYEARSAQAREGDERAFDAAVDKGPPIDFDEIPF